MEQYINVVTNANGSYTIIDPIENLQQICLIDGQRVQLVVEDNNLIAQPNLSYASAPDTSEQTVFSQQSINLGTHLTTAPLDQRQVYIIKTNESPIQPAIYTKTESNNKGNWLNESIELVMKKDATPVKNVVSNVVRNQQQIISAQIPAPNVVVQGGSEKKPTRLVPLNKRHSVSAPVGILRNTLQGTNLQAAKLGKMKRASNIANSPNITLPARSRVSTGGVSTSQLTTAPRGPQARPPIHQDAAQRNSLSGAKSAQTIPFPEMGTLSERIKKQRQQNNEQQRIQRQQPVMAVTPTPRPVQPVQAPTQRHRAMGQLLSSNRQQQHLLQQQQQQQQQLQQLQQQQQHLQQLQQQQHLLQRQQVAATQSRQVQVSTTTEDVEQPMEVDSDNAVQLERLNQLNCTVKSEPEENSSESFAYLQQEIDDPHTAIVQNQITGNEAKMLVILENGEQRLITFEVPKEDCTVQDLLEQANIFSTQEPQVSLVSDPTLGINYIVEVTASRSISHEEENVESMSNETANLINTVEPKTPVKSQPVIPPPTVSPRVSKYIEGMLAVCPFCGMSAPDFNYCMRCKRKLPENVKAIPISSDILPKKENIVPVDTFYKTSEAALSHKVERDAVAKRGRGRGGRGRGLVRTRQIKEPECLTISSDEEDDSRKQKRLNNSKETSTLQNTVQAEECDTILDKEPIITSNSIQTHGVEVQEHLMNPAMIDLNTNLTCRTVRVGSYKYAPSNDIFISISGLKLEVPLLEDEKSFITVDIKYTDLVKVLIHFSKSMPVLFFYPNIDTGLKLRDILGMQDPKGPYFDPSSKDHTHKRITLLPDKITEESKVILKDIFKPIFEEISAKEANDILLRASPKSPTQSQATGVKTRSTTSNSTNSNGAIQTITVYPAPPAKGGIAINTEDFICLAEDQFLNDVIIDFYLKYLTLEIFSPIDHQRTHVFSSYFYKRLTSPHTQGVENSETLSAAARRHARVQKWTKNVNIFEKDFVVIPINEHAHWFLAIICFPGLVGKVSPKVEVKTENQKLLDKKKKDKLQGITVGNTSITPVSTITLDTTDDGSERDEAEGDDEEMETDSDEDNESESKGDQDDTTNCQLAQNKEVVKVPCILIFDSLTGASRNRVVATLRDYLSCEYQAKMGTKKIFTKDTIKGACPKVPQQSNFTDCGLYVLQYVESFFQTPISDYTLPIKTLKNWFEEIIVTRKREELANLLKKLVNDTKGDKISLPTLTFPTQDGKLKQKSETKVAETETKKKTEAGESKVNVATKTSTPTEEAESTSEISKVVTTQVSIPQSSNQSISTTDGSLVVQKEAISTTVRSSADTMAFLKNKRIPRLQKSSDNQEDKQVAKKHKGDSFDSCK